MKKSFTLAIIIALLVLVAGIHSAIAKPMPQIFTLKPGWNAVFLEVEPNVSNPLPDGKSQIEAVLEAYPITKLVSIWAWNPNTSVVEFVQDPSMPVPEQAQMLGYIPDNPVITNLFAINGERGYLIKISGTENQTWTVTGEPCIPKIDWKQDSFNFVGFHVLGGDEPLFADFFSSCLELAGQEIYRLNNITGNWELLTDTLTTPMKQGEAFWIYCNGHTYFTGSFSVQLEQGNGLYFGTLLAEQEVKIINNSNTQKIIQVSPTGAMELYYWIFKPEQNIAGWEFLNFLELTIPAGGYQKIKFGVKRIGMTSGSVRTINIGFSDMEGSQFYIPASVTGISFAGLWVGNVTVNKVSESRNTPDPFTPVKTGSEFAFRLILHAGSNGEVRLMSQVMQMWQEGTWKPDPNDPGKLIVDDPGHFILFCNDALVSKYSGAALRDGQPVGRRISAPVFPNLSAAEGVMSGTASSGGVFNPSDGNTLTLTISLAADDPLNPFRHLFHPDHQHGYDSVRNLTLVFSSVDSDGKLITGVPTLNWGSSQLGGIYRESFSQIYTEGTFLLQKVSDIGTLTMQ